MNKAGVIIVGAGASGLACALTLARGGKKVILLEKEILAGRKILISGNGRCNFTNAAVSPDKYFEAAEFVFPALQNFGVKECLEFFESAGVLYTAQEGRYFPITGKASSVVGCFTNALKSAGAEIFLKTEVCKIENKNEVFKICAQNGDVFETKKLVLACGSRAFAQAGGSEKGYALAKRFGHTITKLTPALSAINLKEKAVSRLAGLRVYANVILRDANGQIKDSEEGEIIFGGCGVSGNNILSISRSAVAGDKLLIDFLPQLIGGKFDGFINVRKRQMAGFKISSFFTGILADNAANLLLDFLGIKKNVLTTDINAHIFDKIIKTVKAWPFTVESLRSEKEACVTRGGVSRQEIYPRSMQSLKTRGLYITGELLDVDGRCGGYNLHFAWASGILAAKDILNGRVS
ncbi:MAG: aminoacetone oxidase family FAD-binding enzyme [Elusimicrobiota bacterium]|jgi:predicted Rossmann fold flavoprotein|nr:aminoacetone oxidase family FAD-binding enzyme [Elusimicrobiota bacterium]